MKKALLLILGCLFSLSSLQAQLNTFLYGTCPQQIAADSAYFILSGDSLLSAIAASPLSTAADEESGVRTFFAKVQPIPTEKNLSYWLVCATSDQQSFVSSARNLNLEQEGILFANLQNVKQALLERRQLLVDQRSRLEARNSQLRRLKDDAALIGGYNRVAILSEEVLAIKNKIYELKLQNEQASKDIERLQFAPAPVDLPVRERNIKQNLSVLAQEFILEKSRQKEARAQGENPQQLADLANQYDLASLENQLNYLRMQRLALESQYRQLNPEPQTMPTATEEGIF